MGFSEIAPCPFKQAYVKLNSTFDRDDLVHSGPHPYTDVHFIFQKHNEGMNWRRFVMNRGVWMLLSGFPFDRRCMHEISKAISSFGILLQWDRARSTRASLLVKVRVEALRGIPASLVVGEGNDFQIDSDTVPVVILQQQILGEEAPDEDPIPPNGNPHPIPQ